MLNAYRLARPLLADLAVDVHPGRWPVSAAARDRLVATRRSRLTLSRDLSWLTGAPTPPREGWWEALAIPECSWALLKGASLWRAGLWLGAGAYRGEVAGLVLRSEVADFSELVGEDARRFALRQAALVWRGAKLPGLPDGGALVGRVVRTAGLALGCWLAGLPAGVAERTRLKLSPVADPDLAEATSWPEERRNAWSALLLRLFPLIGKDGERQ